MDQPDHRYPTPLVTAVLLRRYKRFLADVALEDGRELTVHCANPGSMRTCSDPGSAVRIRDSENPRRKLRWSLEQVRAGSSWVGVNTALSNRVVEAAIGRGGIEALRGYADLRREVSDGRASRLDFRLEGDSGRCWVEVKNVTLRAGGEARFPDAVTARGLKHLRTLSELREAGDRAVMLYLVSRTDVRTFRPAWEIDPDYAEGLQQAVERGVEVLPVQCRATSRGLSAGLLLPYDLGHA